MSTWQRRIAAVGVALGVSTLLVFVPVDALAQAPAVDPAATQKLKQMTTFLDGLQQFGVRTQNTIEDLHVSGHRVDYDLSATVTVKRPNKLHAARAGELMDQRFYYDGKTLALHNPAQNVYAIKVTDYDAITAQVYPKYQEMLRSPAVQPPWGGFPGLGDRRQAALAAQVCRHRSRHALAAEHHHGLQQLERGTCRRRCPVQVRAAQGRRRDPLHHPRNQGRVRSLKSTGERP